MELRKALRDRRNGRSDRLPFPPGRHLPEPRLTGSQERLDDTVVGEVSVEQLHWGLGAGGLVRAPVAPPIGGDQVQPAIPIEVSDRNPVPPALPLGEPQGGRYFGKMTFVIVEQAN